MFQTKWKCWATFAQFAIMHAAKTQDCRNLYLIYNNSFYHFSILERSLKTKVAIYFSQRSHFVTTWTLISYFRSISSTLTLIQIYQPFDLWIKWWENLLFQIHENLLIFIFGEIFSFKSMRIFWNLFFFESMRIYWANKETVHWNALWRSWKTRSKLPTLTICFSMDFDPNVPFCTKKKEGV